MMTTHSDPRFVELDAVQWVIERMTDTIWHDEPIEEAGLALSEEAGEVAKGILKRNHQRRGHGDREQTDWDAYIRKEVSQVFVTILKIAQREGFSLREALVEEMAQLQARIDALALTCPDCHDRGVVYERHGESWEPLECTNEAHARG